MLILISFFVYHIQETSTTLDNVLIGWLCTIQHWRTFLNVRFCFYLNKFPGDKKSFIIHEIQVSQQKNNKVKEMKMKNNENLIRKKPKTCDYSVFVR